MLQAFRLNLQALSLLALFVGIFLVYNTAMFAVVSRRKDAGILRSLGANRREIVFAFLSEILFLGALGGALGGIAGYFLEPLPDRPGGGHDQQSLFFPPARSARLVLVDPPDRHLAGLRSKPAGRILSPGRAGAGGPGPGPAGPDGETGAEENGPESRLGRSWRSWESAWVFWPLLTVHVYFGFASSFALLIGASLLTGLILVQARPRVEGGFSSRMAGLSGKVAAGNIRQNLGRTSVAVAAFMVALSMSIGLSSMIGSFRQSLIWWMGTQLQADLYIGKIYEMEVPEDFYEERQIHSRSGRSRSLPKCPGRLTRKPPSSSPPWTRPSCRNTRTSAG